MQTGRADGLSRSPMSRRTGADLGVVYRQLPHSLVSASTTVAVIRALAPRVLVRRRPNEVPNIKTLGGEIDGDNATQVREEVAEAEWNDPCGVVHGDVTPPTCWPSTASSRSDRLRRLRGG